MFKHAGRIFSEIHHEGGHNLSDLLPALVILLGVLNGILLPIVFDWSGLLTHLGWATPLIILSFMIMPRRRAVVFLLASLFSIISLQIVDYRYQRNCHSISAQLQRSARIVVRVIEPACCGQEILWLPNPRLVRAEVIKIKFQGESRWREVSGRIALRLPRAAPQISFGDIIELQGSFSERSRGFIEERILAGNKMATDVTSLAPSRLTTTIGSKSFARYLKTRGMKHIFVARRFWGRVDNKGGIYGMLLGLRNTVLRHVTTGISSENHRRMLATLLFGCRQGVDRETKRAYIQSGTIHIFTVSGLHVGILALILFGALRWAPFKVRYIVIPLLVAVYAAITGMQPPAVRALLMLAIWSWSRAFLLNIPTLNVVFFAAALLLLKNPYYIQDMGFQFSFLVVGFLVGGSRNLREWIDLSCEARRWIPDAQIKRLARARDKYVGKFVGGIGGCLVAWLAGSGIALYYQGIFFPFSIMANFILIPIVLLIFNLIFLKIIFGWFPWLSGLLAGLLDVVIGWTNKIVMMVDEIFDSTAAIRPGLGSLLLFYLFLSILITAKTRARFMLGAGGLLGVIIFWHVARQFIIPGVIVVHGGNARETSVVIHEPALASAVIVNMPSYEVADCVAELLSQKGIRKVSKLVFAGNRKNFSAGADSLFARIEVEELIQLEPGRRGRHINKLVERAIARGIGWRQEGHMDSAEGLKFSGTQMKIKRKKEQLTVAYASLSCNIKVIIDSLIPGRREVTIWDMSGTKIKFVLTNSSIVEAKEYAINQ